MNAKEGTDGEQLINTLCSLLEHDPGAAASITVGDDDELQYVGFQTSGMATIFDSFPEVLMFDGTYRVNKSRYIFLFILNLIF